MSETEMSFLDHLEELRWRIIKSVSAVLICAIPCGIFWKKIFTVLMIHPLRFSEVKPKLITTAPHEAIVLSIKIAFLGGVILAMPIVIYQLWRFIAPGLYKNEKIVIIPTVIGSTISFLLGISFAYFVLPYIIKFLSQFGSDLMSAMYKINEYLGFLIKIILAFGIVFQLPVASYVLTKMGVLTPQFLIKQIRYAVVIIFIVAALLTPPDIISQTMLAAPLLVLYGISIIVSFSVYRKAS